MIIHWLSIDGSFIAKKQTKTTLRIQGSYAEWPSSTSLQRTAWPPANISWGPAICLPYFSASCGGSDRCKWWFNPYVWWWKMLYLISNLIPIVRSHLYVLIVSYNSFLLKIMLDQPTTTVLEAPVPSDLVWPHRTTIQHPWNMFMSCLSGISFIEIAKKKHVTGREQLCQPFTQLHQVKPNRWWLRSHFG